MQHSGQKFHLNKDTPESDLIAACRKKDAEAQRIIYERLYSKMLAVCQRYTGDRETAKDITQDGFVVLFDKIGTYAGLGSFEGWARKIFVNLSLSYLRKKDTLRYSQPIETTIGKASTSGFILENISAADIMRCIEQMPTGFRTIFNMYAIEGYTHSEIAKILNINEGTSRSQYSRARAWLQQKLKGLT
ncbi:MAG: sigma-70 family RNA polymerase sigma factor [Bacteroidales bacterium]|jgi:RNA polymerase sigma factor (sigma-70 family)|nr:sigma-70 family RNA polymerase sigma factor [Bacteroidales bacterium]HHV40014.1 sigma-70 family RNA polymerase sigma factor [Bacteroidales bacterium]